MKVILLGPPGAGKGTQAEVLCKHFKIPHISTGNILREAIESGSRFGHFWVVQEVRGSVLEDESRLGRFEVRIWMTKHKILYIF